MSIRSGLALWNEWSIISSQADDCRNVPNPLAQKMLTLTA